MNSRTVLLRQQAVRAWELAAEADVNLDGMNEALYLDETQMKDYE